MSFAALFEFEQALAEYTGSFYAVATDDQFVYVGGGTRTVRVIEDLDLIKIIRRYQ